MRCGVLSLRGMLMLPPSRGCRRRRSAAGGRTSCCFAASRLLSRWRWAPSPSHSSAGSRTSSSRASRSTLSTSRSQPSSLEALACPGSSTDCTGQLAAPSTFGRRGCCCCWRGPPQGARAFARGRCGCAALPPPGRRTSATLRCCCAGCRPLRSVWACYGRARRFRRLTRRERPRDAATALYALPPAGDSRGRGEDGGHGPLSPALAPPLELCCPRPGSSRPTSQPSRNSRA